MKTSMKKKALVSSVAMLSVATLALGTATYAWFTQSTDAKASGVTMATSKNSQLQISKLDKEWMTEFSYAYDNQEQKPASTSDGKNWYTANAAVAENYAMDEAGATAVTPDSTGAPTGYGFAEQLNVKNSGSGTFGGVTIKFTLSNIENVEAGKDPADYVRFAIVPVTDADTNKTLLPDASAAFLTNVYGFDNQAYSPLNASGAVGASVQATALVNGSATVDVGDLAAGEAKYYNVYAWFEGQDSDCYDANAGMKLPEINFEVKAATLNGNPIA